MRRLTLFRARQPARPRFLAEPPLRFSHQHTRAEAIELQRLAQDYGPYAYALLRLVIGAFFAGHGAQNLMRARSGALLSLIGLAGFIEFAGGLLIAVGWLTHTSAFISSGQMAAAYFMAHAPRGLWPLRNGGELAAIYSFLFLHIAAEGAGPWSLDRLLYDARQAAAGRATRNQAWLEDLSYGRSAFESRN